MKFLGEVMAIILIVFWFWFLFTPDDLGEHIRTFTNELWGQNDAGRED